MAKNKHRPQRSKSYRNNTRKSYGSGRDALGFLLIASIVLGIGFFLLKPGTTANVGDDFPAIVDENGYCVSREGIETGLCCATWDPELKKEVWVLCEELVQPLDLQAFFQYESGDVLSAVSSIMFSVKITNEGNAPAQVKINSVDVTNIAGGDAASANEIETAFSKLIMGYQTVEPHGEVYFNMNADNRIRLDVPEGTEEFLMADGIYEITLSLRLMDENNIVHDGGFKTVRMNVEQENIAFSIDVDPI